MYSQKAPLKNHQSIENRSNQGAVIQSTATTHYSDGPLVGNYLGSWILKKQILLSQSVEWDHDGARESIPAVSANTKSFSENDMLLSPSKGRSTKITLLEYWQHTIEHLFHMYPNKGAFQTGKSFMANWLLETMLSNQYILHNGTWFARRSSRSCL